jgi:hypothetical protein
MKEVTFKLPEKVFLVEADGHKKPLDIGRVAIAGYAEMVFFLPEELRRKKEEAEVYPYPLLVIDGLGDSSVVTGREYSRAYHGLELDADDQWVVRDTPCAQAVFPRNNGKPYVQIGDDGKYSTVDIKLFEEPIPCDDQKVFEQAVCATQEE